MKILNDEQLAYLKSLESPKKRRKFMLDFLVENAIGESVKFEEEINRLNISYQTSTAPETFKKIICNALESEEGKLVGLLNFCGYSESDNKGVDLPENLYQIKDSAIILDNVEDYDIRQFGHLFISINGNFHSAYVRTIGNNLKIDTANKIEDGAYEVFVVEGNKIVPFVKNNQSAKSNYTPEEIEIAKSLNSEREEKKQIVKDEKFRRTVDEIEKKWTDEDMERAFLESRKTKDGLFAEIKNLKHIDFAQYLNFLKND